MPPDDHGHAFEVDADSPRPRLEYAELHAAMIERSVLGLLGHRDDLADDAAAWIFGEPVMPATGLTFDDCCDGIGVDPGRLRDHLRGVRDRTRRSRSTSIAGRLAAAA